MKKMLIIGMMFLSIMMMTACQKEEKLYGFSFYEYMDTFISVSIAAKNEDEANQHEEAIEEIFKMYHDLSTSYEALDANSPYLENVFSINKKIGEKIEIDKPLYDLLSQSLKIQTMTDGYFDISIGRAVDVWKEMMDKVTPDFEIGDSIYLNHYYKGEKKPENKIIVNQTGVIKSIQSDDKDQSTVLSVELDFGNETIDITKNDSYQKEVSSVVFEKALNDVNKLKLNENKITLEENNEKYYITIEGVDIKLDLGAISKGYATQVAYDYALSKNIKYFSITAGSSSIVLGENLNRPNEEGIFYVSLANPAKTEFTDKATYGTVKVKNMSVTTSGNYEQYVLYGGQRYHHIVSPFTKKPAQYYHTVTILGKDAGLLDALSTALFSMSPAVMEAWLLEHQSLLDIEIIIYNQNGSIKTYLNNIQFEEH